MEHEIKPHPIYTNYGSDKFGNCYNINRNNLLKYHLKGDYNQLCIRYLGNKIYPSVHKFVYECFNGVIDLSNLTGEGLTIDHIDTDKNNNSIDNLRLLTRRENAQRMYSKTSKYTGVSFCKRDNIFSAHIQYKGKNKHIQSDKDEKFLAQLFDIEYHKLYGIKPNKEKYPEDFK